MITPALSQYLEHLRNASQTGASIKLDLAGRAQARFFNATLTSAFQPIRALDNGRAIAYQGFARSYSESDSGLSLWKLLDHSASDAESVELDRLCRMLHTINFHRQTNDAELDLYLSVHARLLEAVDNNHGTAFRRVLDTLGFSHKKIVLQLPPVGAARGVLLNYVSENYRRNGFRIAIDVTDAEQGHELLGRLQPDVIKVDAREKPDMAALTRLLVKAKEQGVLVIFKRVENPLTLDILQRAGMACEQTIHAQGYLLDVPQASLALPSSTGMTPARSPTLASALGAA